MRWRAVLVPVLVLGGVCAAGEDTAGAVVARKLPEIRETGCHFLWKIEKDGKTAWLLGSIHAAPRDFYPLPKPVMDAYAGSGAIALEVYSDDQQAAARAQGKMMESGKYPEGEGLKDHIPEDLFKRFQAFCKEHKFPFRKMQGYRPWSIASFIENRGLSEMEASDQQGVESFFVPRARRDGKPVRSLEELEPHFGAPFAGDDKEGAALIEQTIAEYSAFPIADVLRWTLDVWKAGDADTLCDFVIAEQIRRYPGLAPYHKRMVFDRNVIMADRIEAWLKEGTTVFSIAGMMHCGGAEGVPALLKKKGYTVTQVAKTKEAPAPAK